MFSATHLPTSGDDNTQLKRPDPPPLLTHHVVRATKGLDELSRCDVLRVPPARTRTQYTGQVNLMQWPVSYHKVMIRYIGWYTSNYQYRSTKYPLNVELEFKFTYTYNLLI